MTKADLAIERYLAANRSNATRLTLAYFDMFAATYRPPAKPKSEVSAAIVAGALAMAAKGAARRTLA